MVQDRRAYGIDGSNRLALYSVGQWFKNWMVRNISLRLSEAHAPDFKIGYPKSGLL
jgi:hypothetical protein